MTHPAPSWETVPVFGTWRKLDGSPHTGHIRFTVSTRVVSVTDEIIFPAGSVFDVLLDDMGHMSVDIPAVDDPDNTPSNWSVKVEERLTAGGGETYYIQPTLAMIATGGFNLRKAITNGTPAPPDAAALKGAPGGYAELNSQGLVINADGSVAARANDVASKLNVTDLTKFPGELISVAADGTIKGVTHTLDYAEETAAAPIVLTPSVATFIPGCVISVPPTNRYVEITAYVPFQVTAAGAGAVLACIYEVTNGTAGGSLLLDGAGPVGSLLAGTWSQYLEGVKTIKLGPQTTERQFALAALLVRDAASLLAAKYRSTSTMPKAWIEAVAK